MLWLDAVLKKANLGDDGLIIPIERVKEEMRRRFPNRWDGDFSLVSHGCRFWDTKANNPTATIVTEYGMVCFTGTHSFRSWKQIFAEEFITSMKLNFIGKVLKDCYFSNNRFYVKNHKNKIAWSSLNRQNMESYSASLFGLRSRLDKDSKENLPSLFCLVLKSYSNFNEEPSPKKLDLQF